MKLSVESIDSLPRLAWCAKIARLDKKIRLWHGPWVETSANFFVEGAWSGNFEQAEFDRAVLMGSGGKLMNDHLRICCPYHTLEPISVVMTHNEIFVSNSIAFLLSILDDLPHPYSIIWGAKLASIVNGIDNCPTRLPTKKGRTIRLFYHCDIDINDRLQIRKIKRAPGQFLSYSEYRQYVEDIVAQLGMNASDRSRRFLYSPLATVSSGYDSCAAAVMARSIGCTEALTVRTARGGVVDSGEEIARILGMDVHVLDNREGLRLAELNDLGVPDFTFAFEPFLAGRMLFTGHFGGSVWSLSRQKISRALVRGDPSGCGLGEFRLRVGWVHVPIPFIGSLNHPEIFEISTSQEMQPWQTPGKYSRPIPRRIVEDAGVSRHLFGMNKKAAGIMFEEEGGLSCWVTVDVLREFERFVAAKWNLRVAINAIFAKAARSFYGAEHRFKPRLERILARRLGIKISLPTITPREWRLSRFHYFDGRGLLCPWAYTRSVGKYAAMETERLRGGPVASSGAQRPDHGDQLS